MNIDQDPQTGEVNKNPEQENPEALESRLLSICQEIGVPDELFADYVWIVADEIRHCATITNSPSATISGNRDSEIRVRRNKLTSSMTKNPIGIESLKIYQGIAVPKVFLKNPQNEDQRIINPVYLLPLGDEAKEEAHIKELRAALRMLEKFLKIEEDEKIRGLNEASLKQRVATVATNSVKKIISEALQADKVKPTTNPENAQLN